MNLLNSEFFLFPSAFLNFIITLSYNLHTANDSHKIKVDCQY